MTHSLLPSKDTMFSLFACSTDPAQNTTSLSLQSSASLEGTCNAACGCNSGLYDPVCADGIQYFSPCHAGCPGLPVEDEDGYMVCIRN